MEEARSEPKSESADHVENRNPDERERAPRLHERLFLTSGLKLRSGITGPNLHGGQVSLRGPPYLQAIFVNALAGTTSKDAAGTKFKISWIEGFVNDLLDPVDRARRAKAAQDLREGRLARGARPLSDLGSRPTHRPGWVLTAVIKVLERSAEPMRAIAIHAAIEDLLGEPVAWSSVKNCLSEGTHRQPPRFERTGRGLYRIKRENRT